VVGRNKIVRGTGLGREVWPVLMLLLLAVIVPTGCVLWFMRAAMRNERLAVARKLEDAYRGHLLTARDRLEAHWRAKIDALTGIDPNAAAPEVFARLVRDGAADSVVVYDRAGQLRYPRDVQPAAATQASEAAGWGEARSLEYERRDPIAAAAVYAKLAESASTPSAAARALQARARCLAKAGQTQGAIEVLTQTLGQDRYRNATDAYGRLIPFDAMLRALQLMGDPANADFGRLSERLQKRVVDYGDPAVCAGQRRFLMRQLQELLPERPQFPTLAAEDLAAAYLATTPAPPPAQRLAAAPMPGVWHLAPPSRTVVALFREDRLLSEMQLTVGPVVSLPGASLRIRPPAAPQSEVAPFRAVPAGQHLPEWELALYLDDPDPFASAAEAQITAYLWTGVLVILAIAILALLVARHVARQVRVTRLKNELIATVSHELKTPLASMRVLADTLLAGKARDEGQAREYVELIAKENARLSRLIDNFLTFSRMERNKRSFEFTDVRVEEITSAAVDTVRERFASHDCRLDVEVAPDLPAITGDRDALVTVLINLLDNAYKYSQDDKHIVLRAYADDGASGDGGQVCFEVEDNGIGLSRRAARRVFDRFYQVDQTLSRKVGGCGLGLSIVKFIVDAHGGSVDVTSQPGQGSVFAIRLPASDLAAAG